MEDATTYLDHHPTEHATAEDLINCFTDIQDEHDDIMDEFRQMLQENTADTTPQQQNTNATTVQAPTQLIQFSNSQYKIEALPDVNIIRQQPSAQSLAQKTVEDKKSEPRYSAAIPPDKFRNKPTTASTNRTRQHQRKPQLQHSYRTAFHFSSSFSDIKKRTVANKLQSHDYTPKSKNRAI